MKIKTNHPVQPVIQDEHGVLRYKKNGIVDFLLRESKWTLNDLAPMDFTQEDWEQFSQLTGYSVCGMNDLGHTTDRVAAIGAKRSEKLRKVLAALSGKATKEESDD